MGYTVSNSKEGLVLRGEPDKERLTEIKSNLHHLTNAMQKPVENIYQQLQISVPGKERAILHKSGVLDNKFITFQLPQIVMENQQSSLVCNLSL